MNASPDLDGRLAALERFAHLLDAQWRVPGTRFRFGLESVVGAIPGFGDAMGFLVSSAVVITLLRYGGTPWLVLRMAGNVVLDFAVGLVPILGDMADMAYKANLRNVALLRAHYASGRRSMPGWMAVGLALLLLVSLLIGVLVGLSLLAVASWPGR